MGSVAQTIFLKKQKKTKQQSTTWLAGQPEPELPSHHITSGTGFSAAAPWEQSWVSTEIVWPLSYVTVCVSLLGNI